LEYVKKKIELSYKLNIIKFKFYGKRMKKVRKEVDVERDAE